MHENPVTAPVDHYRGPLYYNSTSLRGDELASAKSAAANQDMHVLAIFKRHGTDVLTPSEVWREGREYGKQWLLTSVRRSINTLTKAQLLVHCAAKRQGPYGRPESTWGLAQRQVA